MPDWTPPALVPPPAMVQPRFAPFAVPDDLRIVAVTPESRAAAGVLADHLLRRIGRAVPVTDGPAGAGCILLAAGGRTVTGEPHPEGFAIEVFPDTVGVYADTPEGFARGVSRLLQLPVQDPDSGAWMVPPVYLVDAPRYEWRGLMLDLARFPHPVDAVLETLDLAFLFGINRVQLHLTDDQAFTFPSELLPPRTDPGQEGEHRGYSRADLERIVRFAAARGIRIVPELDMPGHSIWLVRHRPDLFGRVDAATGEAVSTGVVNMTSGAAIEASLALLDEVMEVFGESPEIHLGGDEVWGRDLVKLPGFAAFAEAKGLPTEPEASATAELLAHFLKRTTDHVLEAGRQPILWEGVQPSAAEERTLDPRVVFMSWNMRSRTPASLIEADHRVINANWEPLYVVPAQGWASRPADALDWTPRSFRQRFGGETVDLPADAPVMGSQICVWEQRPEAIVPALLRLLPELSTRMWGAEVQGDAASFAAAADGVRSMALAQLRPVAIGRTDGCIGTGFDGTLLVTHDLRGAAQGIIRYGGGTTFDFDVTAEWGVLPESGRMPLEATFVVGAALFDGEGNRIGWPTRVRLENSAPVMRFSAWEVPRGGEATLAALSNIPEAAANGWIGRGVLAAPSEGRIDAINREQFAKVNPAAHVDLRPLLFEEVSGLHRIDPERPRIWGQHMVRATGQIEVPTAGEWTLEASSRNGVARLELSSGATLELEKNGSGKVTVELEQGRHGITLLHLVPDVHNDLQVTLEGPSGRSTLVDLLVPLADHVPEAELVKAR